MQQRLVPFSYRWLLRWRITGWKRPGWLGLLVPFLAVPALTTGLGYLYLGEGYIYYRTPVPHFNPNAQIGKATFAVLESELINRQCFPICVRGEPDFMLIQTSATSFEEIVAYSRRLASPNDNDLAVLFVRNVVQGQPWKKFAQGRFRHGDEESAVPANCLAIFSIRRGTDFGVDVQINRTILVDLQAWHKKQEYVRFETRTNYFTDSLIEIRSHDIGAKGASRIQETSRVTRTIEPTDAAYYSPYRSLVRRDLAR